MWKTPERQGTVVLLVEDDEDLREMTTAMLELRGFVVMAAKDAVSALMACRVHDGPIDVLLTDIGLPGVSGGELSRSAVAFRPAMKVVYISAAPRDIAVKRGLIKPGAVFLSKPYTADVLAGTLRTVLAQGASTLPA